MHFDVSGVGVQMKFPKKKGMYSDFECIKNKSGKMKSENNGAVKDSKTSNLKDDAIASSSQKNIAMDHGELEEKNKYEEGIVTMIDSIEGKIKNLSIEGHHMTDQAKEKFYQQMETLAEKKAELEETLNEIKESSSEKWRHFQAAAGEQMNSIELEANDLLEGVKKGFGYLFSKFRK